MNQFNVYLGDVPDLGKRPVLMGTGHRPNRLWGYDFNHVGYQQLRNELRILISSFCDKTVEPVVVNGGAIGFDQILWEESLHMRDNEHPTLTVMLASPFVGQEAVWPESSKTNYRHLCDQTDIIVRTDKPGYRPAKMLKRDQWMVNQAQRCVALWDGEKNGGTYSTIALAHKKGIEVLTLMRDTLCARGENNGRS